MPTVQFDITEEDLDILTRTANSVQLEVEIFLQEAIHKLIESLAEAFDIPDLVNKSQEKENN